MTHEQMARKTAEIMGWIVERRYGGYTYHPPDRQIDGWTEGIMFRAWSPAERIEDAWVLVEWMLNKSITLSLTSWEADRNWTAQFYTGKAIDTFVEEGTAPLAITRAFLRAHGEEV